MSKKSQITISNRLKKDIGDLIKYMSTNANNDDAFCEMYCKCKQQHYKNNETKHCDNNEIKQCACTIDYNEFKILLNGPKGTPYVNGKFILNFITANYPSLPPTVTFETPIYHPNILGNKLCLDLLSSNWTPVCSLLKIIQTISSLLSTPNPNDPLASNIGNEFRENPKKFNATAMEWTTKHAIQKNVIKNGVIEKNNDSIKENNFIVSEKNTKTTIEQTTKLFHKKEMDNIKINIHDNQTNKNSINLVLVMKLAKKFCKKITEKYPNLNNDQIAKKAAKYGFKNNLVLEEVNDMLKIIFDRLNNIMQ